MASHELMSKTRRVDPLRLDSITTSRGSIEMSPSRSSVQSSNGHSITHTPSSSVPNTPLIPIRPLSPEKRQQYSGDSSSFLTELAAHERRVLELKEDLQKAEADLEGLKKQWAAHEAAKKKNELRHVEQLQPLRATQDRASQDSQSIYQEDNSARGNRELDRRKPVSSSTRSSQRKVFAGSRHTRALSLLSPKDSASHSSLPVCGYEKSKRQLPIVHDGVTLLTSRDFNKSHGGLPLQDGIHREPQKDMILETGKQLVGDFRQGLWTFLEDLRQVTVGEEAAGTTDPRKKRTLPASPMPQRQVPKERANTTSDDVTTRQISAEQSSSAVPKASTNSNLVEEDSGLRKEPLASSPAHHELRDTTIDSNDSDGGWDNWDAMSTKASSPWNRHNDAADRLLKGSGLRQNISSPNTTPRPVRSSSLQKGNEIPWPVVTKMSPSNLRRTATNLMSEWEKSLSPPEDDRLESPSKPTKTSQFALTRGTR